MNYCIKIRGFVLSTLFIFSLASCSDDDNKTATVIDVTIKTPPTNVNYLKGEALDYSGLEVTILKDNGETLDVSLPNFEINDLNILPNEGTKMDESLTKFTITHSQSEISAFQNIRISSISNLEIKTPPNITEYYSGEYFDIEGLSITLSLDNGDTRNIETSIFENYGIITSPSSGEEIKNQSEIIITHKESNKTSNQPITLLTLTDIDGNTYSHIRIGEQLWMTENLKTTKYQNGDIIATTTPVTLDISNENSPQYQWIYEGDDNNLNTFGRHYTQYVITDSRNVCPSGWHIPSQEEYQKLISYLIENEYNYDGSSSDNKLGKSIASKLYWDSYSYIDGVPGNNPDANNSSKFNGVPSGTRVNFDPFFTGKGIYTYWWSSDSNQDGLGIAFRIQNFQVEADIVNIGDINTGAPCRCVRD